LRFEFQRWKLLFIKIENKYRVITHHILSPMDERNIVISPIPRCRIMLRLILELWSESSASVRRQLNLLAESVNFSQSMSSSIIRDPIHWFSHKTFSVEDEPQNNSMIQQHGIVNVHWAHLYPLTID
jgi:hypothetical protein